MILLDTDHLTVLVNQRAVMHRELLARLENANDVVNIPVVCVEEQCKGWLALINRTRKIHQQIPAYDNLRLFFQFFRIWDILPLDERCADQFDELCSQKIRVGTQDLKIAAIALANDALLLTANLRDFEKVPGLRVENWLAS
jgi:tRNA(fMet)-specific endonuclease VapC